MAEEKKETRLRLNPDVYKDLAIIAEKERRSLNSQMEHFIVQGITAYYHSEKSSKSKKLKPKD